MAFCSFSPESVMIRTIYGVNSGRPVRKLQKEFRYELVDSGSWHQDCMWRDRCEHSYAKGVSECTRLLGEGWCVKVSSRFELRVLKFSL
jgi:hypothetical protein